MTFGTMLDYTLRNIFRYEAISNSGPPIGNQALRVLWSRDRWRHDPKISEA